MKATEPVEKSVSNNTSLLKNKFNLQVNEIDKKNFLIYTVPLTLSRRRPLSYRNQGFYMITASVLKELIA